MADSRTHLVMRLAWYFASSRSSGKLEPCSRIAFSFAGRALLAGSLAISGSRCSSHSFSWNLILSHGGFAITASKPPVGFSSCQFCHTSGNAASQCRKFSVRAAFLMASRRSLKSWAVRRSLRDLDFGSAGCSQVRSFSAPLALCSSMLAMGASNAVFAVFVMPAVSHWSPHRKSRIPRSSAVLRSALSNRVRDSWTCSMTASGRSSMRCMAAAAF